METKGVIHCCLDHGFCLIGGFWDRLAFSFVGRPALETWSLDDLSIVVFTFLFHLVA